MFLLHNIDDDLSGKIEVEVNVLEEDGTLF